MYETLLRINYLTTLYNSRGIRIHWLMMKYIIYMLPEMLTI